MVLNDPDHSLDGHGFFLANLLHFGRLLRGLEIPIGSQQIYDLAEGVRYINLTSRDDFYYAARAFLLHNIDKLDQFNLAFDLFWSKHIKVLVDLSSGQTNLHQEVLTKSLEDQRTKSPEKVTATSKFLAKDDFDTELSPEYNLRPVYSPNEVFYHKDFADLSEEELKEAKFIIRNLAWQLEKKRTRRSIRAIKKTSYFDIRRSLRKNLSSGEEIIKLEWQRRKHKARPLVMICDISGSMERYSQLFLYFLYALVQDARQIETFVFGTRLTRLTSVLKKKKIESVLGELSKSIMDWSGGTRIGESIKEFNFRWSRRVLGRGSIVVIISDGWDRGNLALLEKEIRRLRRMSTRLIWLNPLAGSPEYEPLVGGIKTVTPYVDDFYPLNNLDSLESLAADLGSFD